MRTLFKLALLLSALNCVAQTDTAFIRHLRNEGLQRELEHYLSLLPPSDTASYFGARFYLDTGRDSLFLVHYFKSVALCKNDSLLQKKASSFFLRSHHPQKSVLWFSQAHVTNSGALQAWQAALHPQLYRVADMPEDLQSSFASLKTASRKKPLVAAGLSVLVPGTGKLYAGKTRTFFFSFALCASYGIQTAESAKKLGYRNPFTVVNAAMFCLFYFSNIYGSYTTVKQLKIERKHQFLNDAANFYH